MNENLWKGIAIAGMWIAVSLAVIFADIDPGAFLFPMFATFIVAGFG